MTDINLESLRHAIYDTIDENYWDSLDMDIVLKSAELCWDETAVKVRSKNFTMIFDLIDYELCDYQGFDA